MAERKTYLEEGNLEEEKKTPITKSSTNLCQRRVPTIIFEACFLLLGGGGGPKERAFNKTIHCSIWDNEKSLNGGLRSALLEALNRRGPSERGGGSVYRKG